MNTIAVFFNEPPKNPFYFMALFMAEMVAIIVHDSLTDYFKYADHVFIAVVILIAGLMITNTIRHTMQNKRQANH